MATNGFLVSFDYSLTVLPNDLTNQTASAPRVEAFTPPSPPSGAPPLPNPPQFDFDTFVVMPSDDEFSAMVQNIFQDEGFNIF
jgi:hypothetical protein